MHIFTLLLLIPTFRHLVGGELSIDADALLVFVFVPLQAWYIKMVASLPQCKDHDCEEYKVRTKHCYCMRAVLYDRHF